MKDDDLPPLPPPLPPTHSRSFSSSSSSSAGSPQSVPTEWSRRAVPLDTRRTTSAETGEQSQDSEVTTSDSNGRAIGGTTSRAGRYTSREVSSDSSPTSTRETTFPHRSSPTNSRPVARPTQLSASSTSIPPNDSLADSTQGTRASAFLSKVSPSLTSHSRYTNSPSNIARLGLRGSPEPLGLGIGAGGFSRHLGGLPSPPPTNSDEESAEGGSPFGTLRAREMSAVHQTEESENLSGGAEGGGGGEGEGNLSPPKPDRPPKSERRSTSSPNKDQMPTIGRTSPTIAGSASGTPQRPGSAQDHEGFRRSGSVSSFRRSNSPSPAPRLAPSASMSSIESRRHQGSDSDAMEELRDGLAGVEPKRRMRARTGSAEADARAETENAAHRRAKQSRKVSELRDKNQRILDSINSHLDPLVSPPASSRGISPSPSIDFSPSRRTIERSSTSSTIRNLAAEDELLHGTLPNFSTQGSSTDEDEPLHLANQRILPSSASDLGEFGMATDSSIRRSATVGDISSQDGSFDSDRRARTAGFHSRPRASLLRQALDDSEAPLPERSATSLSTYPSTIERIRARRSDLVGSDRTRAASSFSDTRQLDQDFSEGMRRLASPSHSSSNVSPPTLRNRPALPSEFRASPSTSSLASSRTTPRRSIDASSARMTPSSSSSRELDRFARSRSAVPSLASPISPSTSTSSFPASNRPPRSEVSFEEDRSTAAGGEDEERERTPKSARKSTFDRVASVGRARTSLGSIDRRTGSVSDAIERTYSRLSRDGRRSELGSPDTTTHPVPLSARSEDRYIRSGDLAARKERLRNAEVGSEAWMSELDNLRRRGTRSRASERSFDGRSNAGDHAPRSPSEVERDRTVKAINALLAGQGIIASAVDPTSPSNTSSKSTSPQKRESIGASERHRRISFANGTHEDSQLPPGSNTMSRSTSTSSRLGSDLFADSTAAGDHHKLLLSAYDHFERQFSEDGVETPESEEFIKRMVALISSTTKLNHGLRGLSDAIQEEQIQSQLDERQRDFPVSLSQFEKTVHSLLRTSDDQVRNLSEDLIAITRVDRERNRVRKEQEGPSRPLSRASNLHQSPPKRPTTAGSVDGATVSLSSSRSPNVPREVFRNPLEDPNDGVPGRRGTLNFPGRSPFATDSPTPASRRSGSTSETPLRRQSISASSTHSSGTGGRPPNRRGKSSDPNRSPTQSGAVPFPTATTSAPIPKVDSTPALSNDSPTRNATIFPKRPLDVPRTYSGASGDAIAYEALEMAANLDEARTREERAAALDRLETSTLRRSPSPPISERRSIVSTPPSELRRPRTRSSMGAIGSALKNAFTPKKKANESTAAVSSASSQFSTSTYSGKPQRETTDTGSPVDPRRERRKEVENILRRSTSRA